MNSKFFEIRDRATCIPAMAFYISAEDGPIARRAGFGDVGCVYLIALATEKAAYDPYSDVWGGARTMHVAHNFITDHFDTLRHGQVIDVRVILGETTEPAVAECA